MKYWKRLLYVGFASKPMLAFLRARTPSVHVAVLMYHELARDDVDIEAWTVVRESDFLRQVDHLGRNYDIASIDDAVAYLAAPRQARRRPLAVITFDDGNRGNATVLLPIVERLGLPVTVYVATQQVAESRPYWFDRIVNALQTEKPLLVDLRAYALATYAINRTRGAGNWATIQRLLEDLKSLAPDARAAAVERILSDLRTVERRPRSQLGPLSVPEVQALAASPHVTVGAHSNCHNILTQLTTADAKESILRSKTLLEQWSGRAVNHFAYPNGSYDDSVTALVRQAGFRTAMTTERRLWQSGDALHCIPRIGIGRFDSIDQFKLDLLGGIRQFSPWRGAGGRKAGSPAGPYAA